MVKWGFKFGIDTGGIVAEYKIKSGETRFLDILQLKAVKQKNKIAVQKPGGN